MENKKLASSTFCDTNKKIKSSNWALLLLFCMLLFIIELLVNMSLFINSSHNVLNKFIISIYLFLLAEFFVAIFYILYIHTFLFATNNKYKWIFQFLMNLSMLTFILLLIFSFAYLSAFLTDHILIVIKNKEKYTLDLNITNNCYFIWGICNILLFILIIISITIFINVRYKSIFIKEMSFPNPYYSSFINKFDFYWWYLVKNNYFCKKDKIRILFKIPENDKIWEEYWRYKRWNHLSLEKESFKILISICISSLWGSIISFLVSFIVSFSFDLINYKWLSAILLLIVILFSIFSFFWWNIIIKNNFELLSNRQEKYIANNFDEVIIDISKLKIENPIFDCRLNKRRLKETYNEILLYVCILKEQLLILYNKYRNLNIIQSGVKNCLQETYYTYDIFLNYKQNNYKFVLSIKEKEPKKLNVHIYPT